MSNPELLFKTAQKNPLIRYYVKLWRKGSLDWEAMLILLAQQLELRVNQFVDEKGIREKILSWGSPHIPTPILQFS